MVTKQLSNADIDNMVCQVNDMFAGVILNLENEESIMMNGQKLVWFSINHTLDAGTGIMMYFSIKDGKKKAWIRLDKGAVSKLHFHDNMIEKFRVLDGKLSYDLYYTSDENNVNEHGVLEEDSAITINSGVWHRVFTTLEDTYLEATFIDDYK